MRLLSALVLVAFASAKDSHISFSSKRQSGKLDKFVEQFDVIDIVSVD